MARQKLDPTNHEIEGCLPLWKLLPEIPVAYWCPSRKHQTVMGVGQHDCPVLAPVVPLVRANCRNVANWFPSSELEVVGADRVWPLPGLGHHME
jgi:hypothetical protein